MTRINRLVMKGFKSFANKIELVFEDKFNCVLGPNGSGKSNVIDALCFVLGKSSVKELRAEKSANLIYHGGKKNSPSKEGVVSIFFDNREGVFGLEFGSELDISRIIKPNGQSVYKINQKTRTRQQILDLLSKARINPDGYNIILQGDITRLIEMSLLERRGMIEEVAGINIYEDKKEKAIRELSRVEEKINEAGIILGERENYIKDLKKERNQALKFKELSDKIKQNKATSIHRKIVEREPKQKEFDKRVSEHSSKISAYISDVKGFRGEISRKKEEISQINQEIEEKGEKEQVQIHKDLERLKVDVALNKQRIATIEFEIRKIEDRKLELGRTYSELSEKIAAIERNKNDLQGALDARIKEADTLGKKIVDFRRKNKLEDTAEFEKTISEVDKKAESLQEEAHRLREEQQNLFRDEDRLRLKLDGIDEKILKVLSVEKEHKEGLERLKKAKLELEKKSKELEKALDYDSSLAQQVAGIRSQAAALQEEAAKWRAKSASIQEHLAGGVAFQKIMELKSKGFIKGIIGSVSELGTVKEDYALALEVAAGTRLSSIVVESDETAAKCIKHLKEYKLGTATFLPLNKLKPREDDAKARKISGKGVRGLAIDLISFSEKYRKVFEYVFGTTLVVDDIETARSLGIGSARMVTLTGDVAETSGAMQGGYRQRKKGIGFQDKEVEEKLASVESGLKDLLTALANLEVKKKNNESRIELLRREKAECEGEIIKLEKSLHLDSADLGAGKKEKEAIAAEFKDVQKKLEELRQKLIGKNKQLADLKVEKQKARDELTRLRSPALLAELNSFEQKKAELREDAIKLSAELKGVENEKHKVLGPEGERIQKILRQNDKEKEDFSKEKKVTESLIKQQELELVDKEKRQKAFHAKFKSLFGRRNKASDEVSKLESSIIAKEAQAREAEINKNASLLESASLNAELSRLSDDYKQYEGVPLFKDKTEEEIEKEIRQFEKMMGDIGAVNMKALEIYERAQSEYDSLMNKKDKLSSERESVLSMIGEIEGKKKELFIRTYSVLNDNQGRSIV
jgi:chromosome segregation protein